MASIIPAFSTASSASSQPARLADVSTGSSVPAAKSTDVSREQQQGNASALVFASASMATAAVAARRRRSRRARAALAMRQSRLHNFMQQLKSRFKLDNVVAEEELLEVQEAALEAEREARALQDKLSEDIEQERGVKDELRDKLQHLKTSYCIMNDHMEMVQTAATVKGVPFATEAELALKDAIDKETSVGDQLNWLDEIYEKVTEEQKALDDQFKVVAIVEADLQEKLADKRKVEFELQAQLEEKDTFSKEVAQELESGHVREEEYRRLMIVHEEEIADMKKQLEARSNLEQKEHTLVSDIKDLQELEAALQSQVDSKAATEQELQSLLQTASEIKNELAKNANEGSTREEELRRKDDLLDQEIKGLRLSLDTMSELEAANISLANQLGEQLQLENQVTDALANLEAKKQEILVAQERMERELRDSESREKEYRRLATHYGEENAQLLEQVDAMSELEKANQSLTTELEDAKVAESLLENMLAQNEAAKKELAEKLAAEQEAKKEMAQQIKDGNMRVEQYRLSVDENNKELIALRTDLEEMNLLETKNSELENELDKQLRVSAEMNQQLAMKLAVEQQIADLETAKKSVDEQVDSSTERSAELRRTMDNYNNEIIQMREDLEGMDELAVENQSLEEQLAEQKAVEDSLNDLLSQKAAVEEECAGLKLEKKAAQQQLAASRTKQDELRRQANQYEDEIAGLRKNLEGMMTSEQQIKDVANELLEMKMKAIEINALVLKLGATEEDVAQEEKAITDFERKLADGLEREEKLWHSMDGCNGDIDRLSSQLETMRQFDSANKLLVGQVDESKSQRDKLQHRLVQHVLLETSDISDEDVARMEAAAMAAKKIADEQMGDLGIKLTEQRRATESLTEENVDLRQKRRRLLELEKSNPVLATELREAVEAPPVLQSQLAQKIEMEKQLKELLKAEQVARKEMSEKAAAWTKTETKLRKAAADYENEITELRQQVEVINQLESSNQSYATQLADAMQAQSMMNGVLEKGTASPEEIATLEAAKEELEAKCADVQVKLPDMRKVVERSTGENFLLRQKAQRVRVLEDANKEFNEKLEEVKQSVPLLESQIAEKAAVEAELKELLDSETAAKTQMAQQLVNGSMKEEEYRRSLETYDSEVSQLSEQLAAFDELERSNQALTSELEDQEKVTKMLSGLLAKKAESEEKIAALKLAKAEVEQQVTQQSQQENEFRRTVTITKGESAQLLQHLEEKLPQLEATNTSLSSQLQEAKTVPLALESELSRKAAEENELKERLAAEEVARKETQLKAKDFALREEEHRRSINLYKSENEEIRRRAATISDLERREEELLDFINEAAESSGELETQLDVAEEILTDIAHQQARKLQASYAAGELVIVDCPPDINGPMPNGTRGFVEQPSVAGIPDMVSVRFPRKVAYLKRNWLLRVPA